MPEDVWAVTNDLPCFLSREFRKPRNDIVVVHPIKGLDARSHPHPPFGARRIDNGPRGITLWIT